MVSLGPSATVQEHMHEIGTDRSSAIMSCVHVLEMQAAQSAKYQTMEQAMESYQA